MSSGCGFLTYTVFTAHSFSSCAAAFFVKLTILSSRRSRRRGSSIRSCIRVSISMCLGSSTIFAGVGVGLGLEVLTGSLAGDRSRSRSRVDGQEQEEE